MDGTDVLEVFGAVQGAVARARSGWGTGLVELKYYRRKGHAQHDPQDYVDPAEIAMWEARDPILRYETWLVERGLLTEGERDSVRNEIEEQIEAAAEQARSEPVPEPTTALEDVYTDASAHMPWTRHAEPDPKRA